MHGRDNGNQASSDYGTMHDSTLKKNAILPESRASQYNSRLGMHTPAPFDSKKSRAGGGTRTSGPGLLSAVHGIGNETMNNHLVVGLRVSPGSDTLRAPPGPLETVERID